MSTIIVRTVIPLISTIKLKKIMNIVDAATSPEEVKIPTEAYVCLPDEAAKNQRAKETFDFFKIAGFVNKVKEDVNILHESLKKKSNVVIFGAGGTTSWFLPKLLKIYNDAFNKVPTLRYDLNIILIDGDIV